MNPSYYEQTHESNNLFNSVDLLNFSNLSLTPKEECMHDWISICRFDKNITFYHSNEIFFKICLCCNHIDITYNTYYFSNTNSDTSVFTDNEIISLDNLIDNIIDNVYDNIINNIEIKEIISNIISIFVRYNYNSFYIDRLLQL